MADKPKLARQAMCDRLAMEFQDEWIVNLGVGMPTLCSNYVDNSRTIITHSENGVIGYGPIAGEGEEDKHLVNAGGQFVTAQPGMSILHHADSFAVIRGGMVDVTVMGAYEVAENGDFANWRIPSRKGGGIGGAMDLAACAKRVFIAMEHTTRDGQPRMLSRLQPSHHRAGSGQVGGHRPRSVRGNTGRVRAAGARPRLEPRGNPGIDRGKADYPRRPA